MKLTIPKGDLQRVLDDVMPTISKKSTIPAIQMAKLSFVPKQDGHLMLVVGTDLETTVTSAILVEVENPKGICIDIATLLPLLKSLEEQPIEILLDDNDLLVVKAAKSSYDIITLSSDEFPQEPELKDPVEYEISNTILKRIVESSSMSAVDALRPIMNGVFMQFENNKLNIAATDAHVMIASTYDVIGKDTSVIIPAAAIRSIKGILGKYESVNMKISNRNIMLTKGTIKYVIRCIEGQYPNYKAVMPALSSMITTIEIDSPVLKQVISRLKLVSKNDNIVISTSGMFMELSSTNPDTKLKAVEQLACAISGEEIRTGFKGSFLDTILNIFGKSTITLHMVSPERASLITSEAVDNTTCLIMPIMIAS